MYLLYSPDATNDYDAKVGELEARRSWSQIVTQLYNTKDARGFLQLAHDIN